MAGGRLAPGRGSALPAWGPALPDDRSRALCGARGDPAPVARVARDAPPAPRAPFRESGVDAPGPPRPPRVLGRGVPARGRDARRGPRARLRDPLRALRGRAQRVEPGRGREPTEPRARGGARPVRGGDATPPGPRPRAVARRDPPALYAAR